MKKRTKIYILASILSVSVLLAVVRQFFNAHKASKRKATESANLVVDRNTWEVIDPANPKAKLSAHNTQEAKQQRYKAVLAFEHPEDFRKQFPPTAEQLARAEEARQAILRPLTIEETLNRAQSPEERKAMEDSLKAMLNPTDVPASER